MWQGEALCSTRGMVFSSDRGTITSASEGGMGTATGNVPWVKILEPNDRTELVGVGGLGVDSRPGQTKDHYKICTCGFLAKHSALKGKHKDWIGPIQDNVAG